MISFGSGQTSGLPLLVTAITQVGAQTLHTCPVGAATPNLVKLFVLNEDTAAHTINVELAIGATKRIITQSVSLEPGMQAILEDGDRELVLNGTATIKVWADAASKVSVLAVVENQSDVAGTACQNIASGLIAAVQNAQRYAVNAIGGTGQATEANGEIAIARAGTLSNLIGFASAAVGGGATVTVTVRKNGVATALALTFANADGTTVKTDTDSVAVAVGDRITFEVSCDNAGAPAANLHAAVQYNAA